MTGLEPCLQVEVVSRRPQTLEACMKEAQLVTDQNLALKFSLVILSMQWLETTGTMRVHWPSLTMTFWIGEIDYSKGDPSLIKAECSSKTIETTWES